MLLGVEHDNSYLEPCRIRKGPQIEGIPLAGVRR